MFGFSGDVGIFLILRSSCYPSSISFAAENKEYRQLDWTICFSSRVIVNCSIPNFWVKIFILLVTWNFVIGCLTPVLLYGGIWALIHEWDLMDNSCFIQEGYILVVLRLKIWLMICCMNVICWIIRALYPALTLFWLETMLRWYDHPAVHYIFLYICPKALLVQCIFYLIRKLLTSLLIIFGDQRFFSFCILFTFSCLYLSV